VRRVYLQYGHDQPEQGMSATQRDEMVERHRLSLEYFGEIAQALYWGTREEQQLRFAVLADMGIGAGDSLLDVGCGFADLYGWLEARGLGIDYTGIDISPDILERARQAHAGVQLMQGELFDFDWPAGHFDWVCLSGTLNWRLDDDGDHLRRVIRRMFQLCRSGLAFNLLNIHGMDAVELAKIDELVAYRPEEILAYCQTITPDCQLRTDYADDDFTIYMRPV